MQLVDFSRFSIGKWIISERFYKQIEKWQRMVKVRYDF